MLPRNLQYANGNKLESSPARSYTACIQPQGGTNGYMQGNTITINIPTSPNTVLVPSESFLKFDLAPILNGANANTCVRLDNAGIHGAIQRLRIMHGSQELENFDNYGNLVGKMIALQQSTDSCQSKLNVLAGLSPGMYSAATGEVYPVTIGEKLNGYVSLAANTGVTANRTYAITLMSMVGSLSHMYIPLFEMTSAPLTIQIQLVSSILKFVNSLVALVSPSIMLNLSVVSLNLVMKVFQLFVIVWVEHRSSMQFNHMQIIQQVQLYPTQLLQYLNQFQQNLLLFVLYFAL